MRDDGGWRRKKFSFEAFACGAAPLLRRAEPVSEMVRAAAASDDEVRAVHDKHDVLKRAAYRRVIEVTAERGTLGQGHDRHPP